ncbi:MAG: phosphoesterase [Blastopirellula sp.]|nr:MAG: phosphoesterase [Blastopirellula sp.]
MQIDWTRLREVIGKYENFLLTSHIRPDCDALGSELGMAAVLRALGKKVTIVNASETPIHVAFMDPDNEIKVLGQHITAEEIHQQFDALMIVDTSAWIQLGDMADVFRESTAAKIVLDHHVSEDELDAEVFKDATCEATGRLVYEAAKQFDVELSPQTALQLFTAIATDTGWFRFDSSTSGTYRAIADLMDAGAVPNEIYAELYEQEKLERTLLRGRILASVKLAVDGRLVYSRITKQDFEETGAAASDTEDAINKTMAIAGTEVGLLFIELPGADGIKVSFRSSGGQDVSAIAGNFGGGGHKAASGATIKSSLEDAIAKVLEVVKAAM